MTASRVPRGVQVEAEPNYQRVRSTPGVLYGKPRRTQKRRRCSGHLADRHYIEAGELVVWSACPPDHPDINNVGWWHHVFCLRCAPIEPCPPTSSP